MNYVFFGTPRFAEIILGHLIEASMPPVLVVTNPDRPAGRKQILTPPPTKLLAQRNNIPVLQPEVLLNSKFEIRNSNPDFAVLASYGKIIPQEVIDLFPRGIIVVHPSLLPKYRGATPIQSTLLSGDERTGTSLILMDEKVDHGPTLAERALEFPISNFQFSKLHDALAELSAILLVETLPGFERGEVTPVPQDESEATYTKKFSSEDAFVDHGDLEKAEQEGGETAVLIDRKIRALNPEPGVWTIEDGKRMKLLEGEIRDGTLKLKKIQREGGNSQIVDNGY
ncbi:methionyl-tRNA formyltransferase [Patescibacteria group bacterium]|nr:methionyl-tRNA formyltransferase [Patescibacteria group bacterium]MCL5114230.1 methionyl-tRNA formyltransferase [Patescibacteria group bacterium]